MNKFFLKNTLLTLLISCTLISKAFCATPSSEPLWIDVRSVEENQQDPIKGDALIPFKDIGEGINALTTNKNQTIYLYCRSGGRASKAKKTLERMGFTHVRNVGGIADARKEKIKRAIKGH